jgi:hypothetical protein
MSPARRSHAGLVLSAIVIVLAGFGVAIVEAMRFPRGSIWIVVVVAALVVLLIRTATARR